MKLDELLDLIEEHLERNPKDKRALLAHAESIEPRDPVPPSQLFPDAHEWYREVVKHGRGRNVLTGGNPRGRKGPTLLFSIFDDGKNGRELSVPVRALRQLPPRIRTLLSTPQMRHALCEVISAGKAPKLPG